MWHLLGEKEMSFKILVPRHTYDIPKLKVWCVQPYSELTEAGHTRRRHAVDLKTRIQDGRHFPSTQPFLKPILPHSRRDLQSDVHRGANRHAPSSCKNITVAKTRELVYSFRMD